MVPPQCDNMTNWHALRKLIVQERAVTRLGLCKPDVDALVRYFLLLLGSN